MKKVIVTALCIIMVLANSACNFKRATSSTPETVNTASTQTTKPLKPLDTTFRIRYSSEDTLDPYKATTRGNREITTLLYDGLASMTTNWTAKPCVAESFDESVAGQVSTTVNSKIKFSDGSPVTPEDVKISFDKAKSSERYRALLEGISSMSFDDKGVMTFKFSKNSPNQLGCLTFPIIKKSEKDEIPLGSGKYIFKADKENSSLVLNKHNTTKPKIKTIHLSDIPDNDNVMYSVEGQLVGYYYTDLASGDAPTTINTYSSVPLNQLVFIGINSNKEALKEPGVRQALSLMLNRNGITTDAYGGLATPALSPFNSVWEPVSKSTIFQVDADIEKVVAQLDKSGYNKGTQQTDNNNKQKHLPEFELLVSNENKFRQTAAQIIVNQAADVGIKINVKELSSSELATRIRRRNFQLYLGELRMTAGMSLDAWLRSGAASYGISSNGATSKAYVSWLTKESDVDAFMQAFAEEMPYIPVCWRQGIAAHKQSLVGMIPNAFDVYYGIENWEFVQS